MYQAYPHAPQSSFHPAQPAPLPYYPAPPAPSAPRRTSPVVWVLAAMGLMTVLGGLFGTCGVVVGLVALGASSDQAGGVILGTQVPQTTLDALKSRNLLKPDEALLAYHDATVRLDMSEVTFVTSSRVVHARGETAAAMALVDVTQIKHHTEGLLGDIVELTADDGRTLRIEIAPLNGGDSYVNVLETAWQKHHPAAHVTRGPQP